MNESEDAPRSREHPDVRFAPPQHVIDLRAQARELAQAPARRGHRQKALYRHGRITVALFTFDAGSRLPEHVAAGAVTINVLDGRLQVAAGGQEHALPAGTLLILAPGVPHAVRAEEPSTVLLQVHLDEPPQSAD